MYNIIFLDIDGVLNSKFWCENHQHEISNGTLIEEEKVGLLSQLIKPTKAKVVLHSGWRFWFDANRSPLRKEAERLIEIFKNENIEIYDITPDLTTEEIKMTKKFSLVKADEILLWISEHKDVKNWVVLDDLDLHNAEVEEHQIKTNPNIGLTSENVEEAKIILSR